METSVKITLIIVSAVILLALIGVLIYNNAHAATISSQGLSQIKATPDIISVYFNVQTKALTAQEAKDNNSEIVDNVITALVKLGFERADITTENFNVGPDYSYYGSSVKSYTATHNIKVLISANDSDKIGDVIDAGVDNGALISYINFELSVDKQNEYKALALRQATEDARTKAEAIAAGLGKSLGSIVSTSSSNFNYYPWSLYTNSRMDYSGAAEAKVASTSIQPGQQDIDAQVSVVFKIK